MFTLSAEQSEATELVADWLYNDLGPTFYLAGHAGTGKTTLARHLADKLNGKALFAAYTGKAAYVMRTKGMKASTLHSLIYTPTKEKFAEIERLQALVKTELEAIELAQARKDLKTLLQPKFTLRENSPLEHADLLIIDECSMVDQTMAADILSFNTPILILGDPGQLPPIKGTGYFTDRTPDFLLTQIHRQAEGDPIIDLATQARKGYPLMFGVYGESRVCQIRQLGDFEYFNTDQILCGKNNTRRSLNTQMRTSLGYYSPYPEVYEKLICLRNNPLKGLLNGMMFIVVETEDTGVTLRMKLQPEDESKTPITTFVHKFPFDEYNTPGSADLLDWKQRQGADEFDWGYAITVHKSQGSQWESVILIDDGFGSWDRLLRKQWLYTGITRAAKRITIAM